ncbi:MAG TPA: ShlB/FhaC/HecB family hemolysin secretion/activation protein, partial [Tepidisphaeraceae bacterium]|nr:ShlB/FhaC/HecB family hemolysin secretion/activation protein [Tepidisphaeraceae bacterium]
MKSGRALDGKAQLGATRAATGLMITGVVNVGMLVVMLLCASEVYGQAAATRPVARPMVVGPARATKEDGVAFRIDRFELEYVEKREGVPAINELMQVEIELGRTDDGYVAPRLGLPTVRFRLANASRQLFDRYYQSALLAIDTQIVRYFNAKGVIGVFVAQDSKDIDSDTGADLRPPNRRAMKIMILVGVVKELRTLASGARFPTGERVNNPAHKKITDNSPVKPVSMGGPELLRKDLLDDYIFRLNRHPSRRVDLAISAAQEQGGVAVDYLVAEAKPWSVYAQVSNTGTRQTNEWRERFGFLHNEVTGHQDTLSIDFITASFSDSQSVVAFYEAPVYSFDRLRWKAYGSWSEFTASDVGFTGEEFKGDEWMVGGELIVNFYQQRELFVDAIGGVRYRNINVTNDTANTDGEGKFLEPYLGLRLERNTEETSTNGEAQLLFGFGSSIKSTNNETGTTTDTPEGLGRINAEEDFVVFQAQVTHSFFLEPLFYTRDKFSTLAHEIALSGRMQWGFDRLIPQEEEVVGGLFTVRGYPESVVAGDSIFVGSIEYRFHYPRSRPPMEMERQKRLFGKPFRWVPESAYGKADWDLILKGFLDVGKTIQTDKLSFENDDTLVGAGVGVEVQFKQNVTLRADWGFALSDIEGEVDTGDNRVHVVFT